MCPLKGLDLILLTAGSNRQSTVRLRYSSSKKQIYDNGGTGFPIVQDKIVFAGGLSYMDTSCRALKAFTTLAISSLLYLSIVSLLMLLPFVFQVRNDIGLADISAHDNRL